MSKRLALLALLLCLSVALTGCPKGKAQAETLPEPEPTPAPRTAPEPVEEVEDDFPVQPAPEPEVKAPTAMEVQRQMQTVYFEFDKYDLQADARQKLQSNAQILKDNPDFGVVVEGHCDERGTIEYNIALGERRASAVRDYLATLGVNRSRIRIRSWGEEKPAVRGSGESAWSQNRRAEFTIE